MNQKYFEQYLDVAPFSLALWRSLEARQLHRVKKKFSYKRPILDLGCGFGEFAGVFYKSSVEVGVDISSADLLKAADSKKYQKVYAEDARKLHFDSQSFSTVISISVMEHIPQVDKAIGEVARVLRTGGYFIITVPIDEFYTHLLYPAMFEKIGVNWLAERYFRAINKAFKHINLWSQQKWEATIKESGFEIVESKKFISKLATSLFDLSLVTALPSQISRWLFGTRSVWGLRWKKTFLKPVYKYVAQREGKTGSNLIIVARKQ